MDWIKVRKVGLQNFLEIDLAILVQLGLKLNIFVQECHVHKFWLNFTAWTHKIQIIRSLSTPNLGLFLKTAWELRFVRVWKTRIMKRHESSSSSSCSTQGLLLPYLLVRCYHRRILINQVLPTDNRISAWKRLVLILSLLLLFVHVFTLHFLWAPLAIVALPPSVCFVTEDVDTLWHK